MNRPITPGLAQGAAAARLSSSSDGVARDAGGMPSLREWAARIALAFTVAVASPLQAADSIVVFNEIHYHPADNDHAREFVELYNQNSVDVDMSGWRLSGGIDFDFPEGTTIGGQSWLVVAADPVAVEGALGPFTGRLDNGGERLRLRNNNDRIMDEVTYNDRGSWAVAPDGSGATLSKITPLTASGPARNWRASWRVGGTPGRENFPPAGSPPPTVPVPLVEFGTVWRYNESGGDPGEDWATVSHEGAGDWQSGAGPLGFETNPARLPVPLGTTLTSPFDNSPFVVTYYFETEFTLSEAQVDAVRGLTMTHSIDDGAVFHLNGVEAGRFNMPGSSDAATFAVSGREANLVGPVALPVVGLIAGVNRFSVEVHQSSLGNSDIVMGLELVMTQSLPDPNARPALSISEVAAAGGPDWWMELVNSGVTPLSVDGYVVSTGGGASPDHVLEPGTLGAGEYLVLTSAQLGLVPADGDRLFLQTPSRAGVLDAVVVKNRPQARRASVPDG
ncbi:MAG: lamin tail domain-containing protein, partial [Akkermansiaceae bacterium]|nr:lamin tail domain-containing protein [Akkermansiaceae bacterium]